MLSSARTQGATVLVQVALSPTPSGPGQIQFFVNAACDPSGSGEGQTPLGVSSFGVNPGGDTNFEVSFSAATVPAGSFLTATATDSGNNTSEFSACAQVAADAGTADLSITKQDSPDPVTVGSPLTYTIGVANLGPNAGTNVDRHRHAAGFGHARVGHCVARVLQRHDHRHLHARSVANGANVSVGIVVTPNPVGPLSNTATVTGTGTDPVDANNTATATTTVAGVGPLTFVVTNTLNSGAGSLRQAILDANARAGTLDTIAFAIPGAGPHTIAPSSPLPAVSDPAIIDGTTQPGFAGLPRIELDGTNAGGTSSGLFITAGNSVVRGLVINRFGTGGPVSQPPAADGGAGIALVGAGNNVVEGNFIGTDVTGTIARPNRTDGVWMNGPSNRIGGTTAAARNVISANGWRGIVVNGANANRILGNYVGVDASGLADLGNGISGVEVFNSTQTLVGGLATAGRNIISGNGASGILISGGTFNEARGNLVGTDVTGTSPVPNGGAGIAIAASESFIGDAAAPNIVAFNTADGIWVLSGNANVISSNSVFSNGGLGINLNADGVTANDPGDFDEGANERLNFPVLTTAAGGVQGTLNSFPDAVFRIEFFGSVACDASGNGEGATFLGATVVGTDGAGNVTIPLFAAAHWPVRDGDGNRLLEQHLGVLDVRPANSRGRGRRFGAGQWRWTGSRSDRSGLAYVLTVTNSGPGTATGVAVTDTLPGTVTFVSASPSQGSCSGTATVTCSLGTIPPARAPRLSSSCSRP